MKLYISADIEGVAGIAHWNEAIESHRDYPAFRAQMSREVAAACEGALAGGATEITVKDAHGSGRNIIPAKLPRQVKLIRGWSGHPLCMVQDIDDTYDALAFVGYHAAAGQGGNPLGHTLSSRKVHRLEINGVVTSEFAMHRDAAALFGVPSIFLSGDAAICETAKQDCPAIHTVSTQVGIGHSTTSIHPDEACDQIRETMKQAVADKGALYEPVAPTDCVLNIWYKEHGDAFYAASYPGAQLSEPHMVSFKTDNYFDVMRIISFVI